MHKDVGPTCIVEKNVWGAQVIEEQWGVVEDSDGDDKRQVGRRGRERVTPSPPSLPDNIYCLLIKNVQTTRTIVMKHSH